MSIESRISQIALAARIAEAAVHDPVGWTLRWGPHVLPARVDVGTDDVTFVAEVPEACYLVRTEEPVTLWHRDVMLGVRHIEHPGDVAFGIDWTISLDISASV